MHIILVLIRWHACSWPWEVRSGTRSVSGCWVFQSLTRDHKGNWRMSTIVSHTILASIFHESIIIWRNIRKPRRPRHYWSDVIGKVCLAASNMWHPQVSGCLVFHLALGLCSLVHEDFEDILYSIYPNKAMSRTVTVQRGWVKVPGVVPS